MLWIHVMPPAFDDLVDALPRRTRAAHSSRNLIEACVPSQKGLLFD